MMITNTQYHPYPRSRGILRYPKLTTVNLKPDLRRLHSPYSIISDSGHLHHQPINVPTAGAQTFLAAGTNVLTCFLKHGGARDNKFMVNHPMTDQRCLTSAIAHRSAMSEADSGVKIVM
jgi:hypothetical protein